MVPQYLIWSIRSARINKSCIWFKRRPKIQTLAPCHPLEVLLLFHSVCPFYGPAPRTFPPWSSPLPGDQCKKPAWHRFWWQPSRETFVFLTYVAWHSSLRLLWNIIFHKVALVEKKVGHMLGPLPTISSQHRPTKPALSKATLSKSSLLVGMTAR